MTTKRRCDRAFKERAVKLSYERSLISGELAARKTPLSRTTVAKYYVAIGTQAGRIVPNILKRDFTATPPNQKWATDVTEFII